VQSKDDVSQLNLQHRTKSGKTEKLKKTDMLTSIGKQPGGIQSVVKKKTVPTSSPEEQERREQPIEPLSPRTRLMKRNIFLNS